MQRAVGTWARQARWSRRAENLCRNQVGSAAMLPCYAHATQSPGFCTDVGHGGTAGGEGGAAAPEESAGHVALARAAAAAAGGQPCAVCGAGRRPVRY
eukprot:3053561-Rhodomonas_salina.1